MGCIFHPAAERREVCVGCRLDVLEVAQRFVELLELHGWRMNGRGKDSDAQRIIRALRRELQSDLGGPVLPALADLVEELLNDGPG